MSDLRELFMVGSHSAEGETPAWADKLTSEDTLAIIVWLQSRWPDETYENGITCIIAIKGTD